MNKIIVPSVLFKHDDCKIFRVYYSPCDDVICEKNDCYVHIVAPDSIVAVQAFVGLYPDRDICSITFLGSCISISPFSPCHE